MKISTKVGSLSPLRLYRNQNPFFPPKNHDSIRSFPKILLRNASNEMKLHRNFLTEKCIKVKDLKKSYILTPKGLLNKEPIESPRELCRYSKSSRLFHYSPLMSLRRPKLKERSIRFLINSNETESKISEFLSEAGSPLSKPETPIQKLKGSPKKLSERRFKKFRLKHIGVVDEGVQAFEDSPRDYFDDYDMKIRNFANKVLDESEMIYESEENSKAYKSLLLESMEFDSQKKYGTGLRSKKLHIDLK